MGVEGTFPRFSWHWLSSPGKATKGRGQRELLLEWKIAYFRGKKTGEEQTSGEKWMSAVSTEISAVEGPSGREGKKGDSKKKGNCLFRHRQAK